MKTRSVSWLGLVALLAVPVYAADSPAPAASEATPGPVAQVPSAPALTLPALAPNAAEVAKLSGASVGDEVIIAYVQNCLYVANSQAGWQQRFLLWRMTLPSLCDDERSSRYARAPFGPAANFAGHPRNQSCRCPNFLAVDSPDNVYVADSGNHTIRKLTPVGANWVVTTLAGLAASNASADGTGRVARFNSPRGIAVDGEGNIYVA